MSILHDNKTSEPPNAVDAEQAVIGSVLISNDVFDEVTAVARPDQFYDPLHQRIIEECGRLIVAGRVASPVTLKPAFEKDEALGQVGGLAYLARLASNAAPPRVAADYAKVIVETAMRRELIMLGKDMTERGEHMTSDDTPDDVLDETEERLFSLRTQFKNKEHQGGTIGVFAERAYQAAVEAARAGDIPGLATGIAALDEKMRLRNGHMIVVAGRPGSGKSSLALAMALNVARTGVGVYFASLEMPGEELATRAASYIASDDGGTSIPYFRIERGNLDQEELDRVGRARTDLRDWPIFFDTRRGLRVGQITAGVRRYSKKLRKQDVPLGLIVIDHMGKLQDSGRWRSDKVNAVSEVSNDIHTLAGALNVPVLAVCQLNRGVESRDDKRPVMSDLRASGTIEEDAHLVMTVYRPAYYLEREKPEIKNTELHAKWTDAMVQAKNRLEVSIAKQRGGPTGGVDLWCDIETNTFRGHK